MIKDFSEFKTQVFKSKTKMKEIELTPRHVMVEF